MIDLLKRKHTNENGQVLVAGIFILIVLLFLIFAGFDIHNSLRAKFKVETGQEAAALAGASWQRDSLNLIGEINLIKVCSMLLEGDENWAIPLPTQESNPQLTPEELALRRKDVLQGRLDILTEMQARVSFIGPLIGLAAAQQAAKANGIPVISDFDHYVKALNESSRYREEFGGAKTFIHNYAWKGPYTDLVSAISRNGVAVLPNAMISAPKVYPRQLALETFYDAILSKYAEITAAEGNAVYPQLSWGMLMEFVFPDWNSRFENPPWWNIRYNSIAFPEESEIFTLGLDVTGDTGLLNDAWRDNTVKIAENHLSSPNSQAIYDPQTGKNIPDSVAMNFFSYDNSWYPSYYRENYEDYDEDHYNYWFQADVLRKKVKKRYIYEGPAAYVETFADVGKVMSLVKVTGQKSSNRSIHVGSKRDGEAVTDVTDYRPGTIAKALGSLTETDPPIALPVVLPVFDKVIIMPTYMPIPYNFNVLRNDESNLKQFLIWLSTRDNLDSDANLPPGCTKYLEALRILAKGPQFRYFGWNPNFDQQNFDNQWRNDLETWYKNRKAEPNNYQYNLKTGRNLPGYYQEPNVFLVSNNSTVTEGIVAVKDYKNGGIAKRHFIGSSKTYMVVDSTGHIVTKAETDPTFIPTYYSSPGPGPGTQLTPSNNTQKRPLRP